MSKTLDTINEIDAQVLTYAPAVIAGVQQAEAVGGSGASKKQMVLTAIQAGAQIGEGLPSPNVSAISGLIDLVVSIFNALVWKKKVA